MAVPFLCHQNTLEAYPCGSDHTPSPMASRIAVEGETMLDSPSARLTAVAVSVKEGHTIAFLGDSKGNLHKVTARCGFLGMYKLAARFQMTVLKYCLDFSAPLGSFEIRLFE